MSANRIHEIRDPIHVFIRLDSAERQVLNSRPFQRLRYIHQLALTNLIYPGATHRRFEHSLGVMELASRVFDVVASNVHDSIRKLLPEQGSFDQQYWKRVLRMAALCHDMGHLPFSHAAESDLLPKGWNHERLTVQIIFGDELRPIWDELKIRPEHVAKLAVGPKEYSRIHKGAIFSDLETIFSEIIVGDAFGVDRIDYLLRDSHHAGVGYGKFDHYRLIDTLRILPKQEDGPGESALGVEHGGLYSAEALLLARYFMYGQLYFHPVRRIYDIHLKDFLKSWLNDGYFPVSIEEHLAITDNEVTTELLKACRETNHPGHKSARRIVKRDHFRLLYERNPEDVGVNPESGKAVFQAMCEKFGPENFRWDSYVQKGGAPDFPVLTHDGRILSSLSASNTLKDLPVVAVDFVFVSPQCREKAEEWLRQNLKKIIKPRKKGKKRGKT